MSRSTICTHRGRTIDRLPDEVIARLDPSPRCKTVSIPSEWMRSLLAEVRAARAKETP